MVFDFLQPLSNDVLIDIHRVSNQALGKKVVLHTKQEFPNLKENGVAIIGVLDNRGNNTSFEEGFEQIRLQFYSLFPGNWNHTIYDLGDIKAGETIEDTYYVLKSICINFQRILKEIQK